jgi:biotin operon repressor
VSQEQPNGLPFIPAALDDLGLSVPVFRVYCRIVRRAGESGVCFESLPRMARELGLWRPTVTHAVQELRDRGMVHVTTRPGRTAQITPLPAERWAANQGGKHTRYANRPGVGRQTAPVPGRKSARVPGLQTAHEGTPLKVLPQGTALRETERAMDVWARRDAQPPTVADIKRDIPRLVAFYRASGLSVDLFLHEELISRRRITREVADEAGLLDALRREAGGPAVA